MKQQQQQQRRRQQPQPQDVASIVQQNDYAAGCIEGGRYDEAIGNLLHALKLSDHIDDGHDDDDHDDNCCRDASRCKKNIMETCMSYGESLLSPKHHNKKRRRSSSVVVPKKDATTTADEESFIYSTPIRAQPTLSIQKDHRLGIVLQLIIIFNLALAYHLRAIQQLVSHDSLRQVLQLYEVAYRLQVREDIRSLRFTMVLANNLGQVHRAAGNGSKYAMCLEHVLSAMMFLLDVQQQQQQQSDQSSRGLFDLDGFARNTSKLILQDQCAAAA